MQPTTGLEGGSPLLQFLVHHTFKVFIAGVCYTFEARCGGHIGGGAKGEDFLAASSHLVFGRGVFLPLPPTLRHFASPTWLIGLVGHHRFHGGRTGWEDREEDWVGGWQQSH